MQEAMVEVLNKAIELDLRRAIIISIDKNLVDMCNNLSRPNWQDQTFITDLHNFHQQGMITQFLFVTRAVIAQVLDIAANATSFPMHCIQHFMPNIG